MTDTDEPQPGPSGLNSGSQDDANMSSAGNVSTLSEMPLAGRRRSVRANKQRVLARKGDVKTAKAPKKADVSMNKTLRPPVRRNRPAAILNYQTLNETLARELNDERVKNQELTRLLQEHSDKFSEAMIEVRRMKFLMEQQKKSERETIGGAVRKAKREVYDTVFQEVEVLQSASRVQLKNIRRLKEAVGTVEEMHEKHAGQLADVARKIRDARDSVGSHDSQSAPTQRLSNSSLPMDDDDVVLSAIINRSPDRSQGRSLAGTSASSVSSTPGDGAPAFVNYRRRRAGNSASGDQSNQNTQFRRPAKQTAVGLPHVSGTAIRKVNIKVDRLQIEPGTSNVLPASASTANPPSTSSGGPKDESDDRVSPEVVDLEEEEAPTATISAVEDSHDSGAVSPENAASVSENTPPEGSPMELSADSAVNDGESLGEPFEDETEDQLNQAAVNHTDTIEESRTGDRVSPVEVELADSPPAAVDDDVVMLDAFDEVEEEPNSRSNSRTSQRSSRRTRARTTAPRVLDEENVESDEDDEDVIEQKRRRLGSRSGRSTSRTSRVPRLPTRRTGRRTTLFDADGEPLPSTSALAMAVTVDAFDGGVEGAVEAEPEEEPPQVDEEPRNPPEEEANSSDVEAEAAQEAQVNNRSPRVTLERLDAPETVAEVPEDVQQVASREGSVENNGGSRSRRATKNVSYKEASLNCKLRRGDPISDPFSLMLAPSVAKNTEKQKVDKAKKKSNAQRSTRSRKVSD